MKKVFRFLSAFVYLVIGTGLLSIAWQLGFIFYTLALGQLLQIIIDGDLEHFIYQLETYNEKHKRVEKMFYDSLSQKDQSLIRFIETRRNCGLGSWDREYDELMEYKKEFLKKHGCAYE
jgi:hypothetical protein